MSRVDPAPKDVLVYTQSSVEIPGGVLVRFYAHLPSDAGDAPYCTQMPVGLRFLRSNGVMAADFTDCPVCGTETEPPIDIGTGDPP